MLFTDEIGFTKKRNFHFHNNHICADENPHVTVQKKYQQQFSINVWAKKIHGHLIRYTVTTYWTNLQKISKLITTNMRKSATSITQMAFMHDGASVLTLLLETNVPTKTVG